MKNKIFAVVIALALFAGVAMAQNTPVPLTNSSGTVVVNTNFGNNYFSLLLGANVTSFSFTNSAAQNPTTVTIVFQQNGTGNFTVAGFASNIVNPPNVSLAANAITVAQFTYDALTAKWYTVPNGGPNLTDGAFFTGPGNCASSVSGNAVDPVGTVATAQGLTNIGASNTAVIQAATTVTGTNTHTFTCTVLPPFRLTAGKGITITDVVWVYGCQGGTLGTQVAANWTAGTITLPAPGASETPSTVTPVAAGGSITLTPLVASFNTGATTAGGFLTEKEAFGTPIAITSDLTLLQVSTTLVLPATTAMSCQVAGVLVHYQNNPL